MSVSKRSSFRWGTAVIVLAIALGVSFPAAGLAAGAEGEKKTPEKKTPEKKTPGKKKEDEKKPEPPGEPDPDGEDASGGDTGDAGGKAAGKTVLADPDAQYVHDNLEKFLSPTKIEFLKDGRVKMEFEFREKKEEHASIFHIPVGGSMQDAFRWTIRDEEWVVGGDSGIRVSNRGLALLKAWWKDDVEAEMEYLQYISHDPKHLAAVIFTNGKSAAVGSNYGSQCAVFSSGRMEKSVGKASPVSFEQVAKIKLKVKDGTFEAHREGKQKTTMKYSPKTYASGQIGIIWGGSISGTIPRLTITGKLDDKKMADMMRRKR